MRSQGFPTLSIPRWSAEEGASISIKGLEPTAYSVRCASAFGSGSGLAFGCAGTNRHDVKECKSPTAKV